MQLAVQQGDCCLVSFSEDYVVRFALRGGVFQEKEPQIKKEIRKMKIFLCKIFNDGKRERRINKRLGITGRSWWQTAHSLWFFQFKDFGYFSLLIFCAGISCQSWYDIYFRINFSFAEPPFLFQASKKLL